MSWSVQAVILGCEMVLGYVLGRVFIPYFRRIKTGKFDFYIGDRFAKDGSEPKFGGVVIMLCVIFGIVTGVIFYDSQAVLSFENGEFSRRVFIALGGVLMLTAIGLSEDYVKEKKLGIGMKPFYKICMEYLICLGVCVGLRYCGGVQTAVLMPFHLGYVQFGRLFYPLFPLFMTVGINMVKIHDCAGGKTDTGTDGLCAVTALIFSAGLSSGLAVLGLLNHSRVEQVGHLVNFRQAGALVLGCLFRSALLKLAAQLRVFLAKLLDGSCHSGMSSFVGLGGGCRRCICSGGRRCSRFSHRNIAGQLCARSQVQGVALGVDGLPVGAC